MQILVIDDCSSVDIKSIVERVGKGRIEYYRHDDTLGWQNKIPKRITRVY